LPALPVLISVIHPVVFYVVVTKKPFNHPVCQIQLKSSLLTFSGTSLFLLVWFIDQLREHNSISIHPRRPHPNEKQNLSGIAFSSISIRNFIDQVKRLTKKSLNYF